MFLVVEDDDLVRENVCAQFRSPSYDVVAVRSGAAAIDALRQSRHVDLLFTDVKMPDHMNGAQRAAEARRVGPDIPVLFTSGYIENAVLHHRQDNAAFGCSTSLSGFRTLRRKFEPFWTLETADFSLWRATDAAARAR